MLNFFTKLVQGLAYIPCVYVCVVIVDSYQGLGSITLVSKIHFEQTLLSQIQCEPKVENRSFKLEIIFSLSRDRQFFWKSDATSPTLLHFITLTLDSYPPPHVSKYKAHGPKVLLPSNRNVPLYTRGVAKRGAKGVVEVMPLGTQKAHPIFIYWPLIAINIATFEYLVPFLLKVFII